MSVRANLIGVAAVACALFAADKWISSKAVIPADIAKQSDFLRTWNPVPLLNSFRTGCKASTGVGTAFSASPGYLFLRDARNVRYTRTAHTDLCDQAQFPAAATAIHRSLLSGLGYYGCEVSSDDFPGADFSASRNVRILYRCGTRSAGTVTLGPKSGTGAWPTFVTLQLDEEWSVRDPS